MLRERGGRKDGRKKQKKKSDKLLRIDDLR